jgi:predicted dehydrogenase
MQVLIIGYGTIGRVKARVWKSLGLDVLVYDTSLNAIVRARNDGYAIYVPRTSLHGEYLVDISTPAGHHWQALEWALANGPACPRAVLIEKPLASNETEIQAFRALNDSALGKHLAHNIFINESYVSSSALAILKRSIEAVGEIIESLEVELSKNRLADNSQGRFFDRYLNAIGHEVPHMLAVLQMFGFDVEQVLRSKPATLYIDKNSNIVCASSNNSNTQHGCVYGTGERDRGEPTKLRRDAYWGQSHRDCHD